MVIHDSKALRIGLLLGVVLAMLTPVAPAMAAGPVGTTARDAQAVAQPAGLAEQTFSTGTVAGGGEQSWFWNAPNPHLVYFVGFDPAGATTSTPCEFQVTRTWYTQQPGGGRQFHFTTVNIGNDPCAAIVILSWATSTNEVSIGPFDKGATWNIHVADSPLGISWAAGIAPQGASSASACQYEVVRQWNQLLPGNNLPETWFTLENTGDITCSATVLLAKAVIQAEVFDTNVLNPGQSATGWWNNVPSGAVYFPSIEFHSFSGDSACKLRVLRDWYQQVVNPPSEREYHMIVQNFGTVPCSGVATISLPPQ